MDPYSGGVYTPSNPAPALESNPPMYSAAVAPPGTANTIPTRAGFPLNNTPSAQPAYKTPGAVPPPSGLVPRGPQDS